MKKIRRKPLYPGLAAAEYQRQQPGPREDEPDILHTASGYCPNYEMLRRRYGMSPEQALVYCNMD